jgi:hypothetical protein
VALAAPTFFTRVFLREKYSFRQHEWIFMKLRIYQCALVGALTLPPVLVAFAQSPAQAPTALGFKSTLEKYKPYTDEKIAPWKAANDEVGKIGGWRAYLKEANEPDTQPANKTPTPNPATSNVTLPSNTSPATTAPSRPANPHAGHAGHGGKK